LLFSSLFDVLELNVEDEAGLWWNVTRETTVTIGVVAGDGQGGLLAESHTTVDTEDALIPALDDLANTDASVEVATADGRVELFTLVVGLGLVEEPAGVFHSDSVTGLGLGAARSTGKIEGEIKWANEPKKDWECDLGRGAVQSFSIEAIKEAMDYGVKLRLSDEEEQWRQGEPYPHKVLADKIQYWPRAPREKDPRYLCDVNDPYPNWVTSYPLVKDRKPDDDTRDIRPGTVRVLISREFITRKDEKLGVVNTFAFCGLAVEVKGSRPEFPYQMCWPNHELDEGLSVQVALA